VRERCVAQLWRSSRQDRQDAVARNWFPTCQTSEESDISARLCWRASPHGTGTLKSSTFRTNKARGAGGGWGQGIVRPRSAQCVLKLWRHFGDEMLPSEGSEACRGLPTVAGRDRVESPHTARAHLRFWLASSSQVGMEAPTIGALAIEHVGRARSQG
jgi:hypothetical protein